MPVTIKKKAQPKAKGHTRGEVLDLYGPAGLQLIVMAAAYEIHDRPLATDASYDILARSFTKPERIPGFDPSTGQWVHDLMTPTLEDLVRYCLDHVPAGEHCHHTYILDWLTL